MNELKMTIEEIVDFWEKTKEARSGLTDFKYLSQFTREQKIEIAKVVEVTEYLIENIDARLFFMLAEADYNAEAANELIERLGTKSELAEYIHLKFTERKGINDFIHLIETIKGIKNDSKTRA
jgi:hypothetical protein